ncbi:hypothetical protein E7Y35_05850 [Spiroplasma sp. SV19]|nr:hypothetical protein E7Y35_05850 [Spiroplasma sp. SV19]
MVHDFNPYDFFKHFNHEAQQTYREKLVKTLEQIDDELFQYIRKANPLYKPKGYKKRYLISIFGQIKLKLHRYKYWDNEFYNSKKDTYGKWRYKILFYDHIKLKKYQRLTHDLRLTILNMIGDGLRHKDILLAFPKAHLTTQTISNVIKRENISEFINYNSVNKVDVLETGNRIYIALDDTFLKAINEKKKCNKYRIRSLTTYTGHIKSDSSKKFLENKKVFYKMVKLGQGINTSEFMNEILEHINRFYIINNDTKLIVGGDGANWIYEISNLLNADYVLDKFHALRFTKSLLSSRTLAYHKLHYKIIRYLYSTGQVDKLLDLLVSYKKNDLITNKNKIPKVINYLKRNKAGIEIYKEKWCLGVCAEGQISHNIKQVLGYGAKIVNVKVLQNMLDLRFAKINGFDPITELKNYEMTIVSEQDHFNKTSRWILPEYSINPYEVVGKPNYGSIPIVQSGSKAGLTGKAITELAYA